MNTPDTNFSEKDSLAVIMNMIHSAKADISDESFYYLLWGWLVLIASLTHYTLLHLSIEMAPIAWMLMPLGGIITAVYGYNQNKKENRKTFVDEFMKYVLIAFLVSLVMVLVFMSKLGSSTYPMILMIYGIWLFVSGGVLKFKPLMAGGIINWAMAGVAFFVAPDLQLLCIAAAVLLGYIIPGYLLKRKFSRHV